MNIRTHIRRPRASTVIASLALFVALGGSATAATLITGAKIKNGTITNKDVKNSTLTGSKVKNGSLSPSDISKKGLASLKGAKGDKGDNGAPGATGAQGVQGPRGVVTPLKAEDASEAIDNNGGPLKAIVGMQLPAGTYVVTAKTTLNAIDLDQIDCELQNAGVEVDTTRWNNTPAASRRTPAMLTAVVTTNGGLLRLACGKSTVVAGGTSDSKLIAIPVS